jgi:hypothetical protein
MGVYNVALHSPAKSVIFLGVLCGGPAEVDEYASSCRFTHFEATGEIPVIS